MMRIILFGTGAMSCLFAARLSGVADVTVVGTWADAVESIRKQGILVEDSGGMQRFRVGAEYLGARLAPAEFVIVLVKSWQTAKIGDYVPRYLSSEGAAVSLQNGLGNVEKLGPRVYPGTTAEGATLLGPGHIRTGGSGPTHMVAPDWAVGLLKKAGLECYGCSLREADSLLWGKLSVSCGINALTALLRIPNGELLKRPSAADLMTRAATECAAVAHAAGIALPFPDAAVRAREVAQKTADNRSSMLQDITRGAPTECDAINGAVVREGKRREVRVPVNEVLWHLVRAAALPGRERIPE
jgi:2-dehydropantoate 2-reductase